MGNISQFYDEGVLVSQSRRHECWNISSQRLFVGLGYFADLRTCGPTNGYFADRKMRTVFADRWVKCGPADP